MAMPPSHSSYGTRRDGAPRRCRDAGAGVDDGHVLVRSIQTSHARVAFAMTLGGGTPLVLLHGRSGSMAEFRSLMTSSLGAERAMVAIDLPGHGGSSAAHVSNLTYTLEGYADSVIEVLDHLGIERIGVLGRELGGYIGLQMASSFPGFAGLFLHRGWPDNRLEHSKGHTGSLRSARVARSSLRPATLKSAHPLPTKDAHSPELRVVPPADDRYRRLSLSETLPTSTDLVAVQHAVDRGKPFTESVQFNPNLDGTDPVGLADSSVHADPDTWFDGKPRRAERASGPSDQLLLQFLKDVDRVSRDLPCLGLCLSG